MIYTHAFLLFYCRILCNIKLYLSFLLLPNDSYAYIAIPLFLLCLCILFIYKIFWCILIWFLYIHSLFLSLCRKLLYKKIPSRLFYLRAFSIAIFKKLHWQLFFICHVYPMPKGKNLQCDSQSIIVTSPVRSPTRTLSHCI